MCGRYAFDDVKDIYEARKILEEIASRLGDDAAQSVKTGEVFPSETAAVVAEEPGSQQGYRTDVMSWGYPLSRTRQLVINARSETIFDTGIFKNSVAHKKCLIPCTGFYEWKNEGKIKEKYLIRPNGQVFFYLAGLYDTFNTKGKDENRFVILTAPANEAMKEIHGRMPLMVKKQHAKLWLGGITNTEKIERIYAATDSLKIKRV